MPQGAAKCLSGTLQQLYTAMAIGIQTYREAAAPSFSPPFFIHCTLWVVTAGPADRVIPGHIVSHRCCTDMIITVTLDRNGAPSAPHLRGDVLDDQPDVYVAAVEDLGVAVARHRGAGALHQGAGITGHSHDTSSVVPDSDGSCPGRKPPFLVVKRHAPIQNHHRKTIYYGKRQGRLNTPCGPGRIS